MRLNSRRPIREPTRNFATMNRALASAASGCPLGCLSKTGELEGVMPVYGSLQNELVGRIVNGPGLEPAKERLA